ncbi:MAG: DUF5131 family protein, partial [bacterium]
MWIALGPGLGKARTIRPLHLDWVLEVRDQCIAHNVPLFFKQWGRQVNNPNQADPTLLRGTGGC